jgi:dienelactone hydrolase
MLTWEISMHPNLPPVPFWGSLFGILMFALCGHAVEPVGTAAWTLGADPAADMVAGMHRWLDRETETVARQRVPLPPPEARARLREILGVVDDRVPPEVVWEAPEPARIAWVRWRVLRDVWGEGLLLLPKRETAATPTVIALGDCDWTPESFAGLTEELPSQARVADRLVRAGCRVLIPVLIDRRTTFSNHPQIDHKTTQPHREFVYRPAYQLGRHVIGYEVQKVLGAVDWLQQRYAGPTGIFGYGEGGLVALYSAALDDRIAATVVSGYFGPREHLAQEPIYRNVWSLLQNFGDAEIASLILPRPLIIEASRHPEVRAAEGATPGSITTPPFEAVAREVARATGTTEAGAGMPLLLETPGGEPGSPAAVEGLVRALGMGRVRAGRAPKLATGQRLPDPVARMGRQVAQLLHDTQVLQEEAVYERAVFWKDATAGSVDEWTSTAEKYRTHFGREIIGNLPPVVSDPGARCRQILDEPNYRGYEVELAVLPDVFAYGILLVPKDIAPGEQLPVVVCQHGLEGRPQDVALPAIDSPYYHRFGCQLADQGYVVFAPQNPYIGQDAFRLLQRKANPLKLSLFSFIVRQHEQILNWLKTQPYVDAQKIAFYGLSYGGKTAMRVPVLVQDYCLSICSGDFNEWIWKTTSARSPYSYQFTGEYEMYEFDLGAHFNYAELSWLIFPRPFMVERGHEDGVAPDERVAQEFARTRQLYDRLGLGDRTTIEFFNGPHTINGVGTFAFLKQHLGNPNHRTDQPTAGNR